MYQVLSTKQAHGSLPVRDFCVGQSRSSASWLDFPSCSDFSRPESVQVHSTHHPYSCLYTLFSQTGTMWPQVAGIQKLLITQNIQGIRVYFPGAGQGQVLRIGCSCECTECEQPTPAPSTLAYTWTHRNTNPGLRLDHDVTLSLALRLMLVDLNQNLLASSASCWRPFFQILSSVCIKHCASDCGLLGRQIVSGFALISHTFICSLCSWGSEFVCVLVCFLGFMKLVILQQHMLKSHYFLFHWSFF